MKKALIFIGYNIVAIIILLLLAEFAVRIFVPEIQTQGSKKTILVDSTYYTTHALKPFASATTYGARIEVDRYGFRKCSVPVDATKRSWLFLGDSVTFGIGVEGDSIFAGILQTEIDSLNVLNPSASGNNIENYVDIFRYFVLDSAYHFNITRVSMFWCLNDIYMSISDFEIPGGKLRYLFSDILTYIRIHSRLYHFTKSLLFDRPKTYFRFDLAPYQTKGKDFQNAVARISEINQLCRERNISFDIVLLPYEYQLREHNFVPQIELTKALRKHNINILDFFSGNKDNYDSKRYFLYGDGIHFSNYGHRQIAQLLLDHLSSKKE